MTGTGRSPDTQLFPSSNHRLKNGYSRLKELENRGISVCQSAGNAGNRQSIEETSATDATHRKWSRFVRVANNASEKPCPRRPHRARREPRRRGSVELSHQAGRTRRCHSCLLRLVRRRTDWRSVQALRDCQMGVPRVRALPPAWNLLTALFSDKSGRNAQHVEPETDYSEGSDDE